MRRVRWIIPVAILLVLAGALVWQRLSAVAPPGILLVAGDVRADIRTVAAPQLTPPSPDFSVGIAPPTTPRSAPAKPAVPLASLQPTVSGLVTHVYATQGDRVRAGQVIAQLDTRMLELGVKQAEASASQSRANVGVMSNSLDTIGDKQAQVASSRSKLLDTMHKLEVERAKLAKQLAQLEALAAKMKKSPPAPPPGSTPGTRTAPGGPGAPGSKPGGPPSGAPQSGAPNPLLLIPKLKAALAKIDAGLAKLRTGLTQLQTAGSQLSTLKTTVTDARSVLEVVSDSQDIVIAIAKARLAEATIVAPAGGVVTFVLPAGSVAMVGAPIARIAASGSALVDTYLTGDQLRRIRIGSPADVTYDSAGGSRLHGEVSVIGDVSEFPPTSFPTEVIHMTRTVRVTIRLDKGRHPPEGTPVDLAIHTSGG